VSIQVCAYKNSEAWSEHIWEISNRPPFENPRQGKKKRKNNWLQLHEQKLDVKVEWDDVINFDEIAAEIVEQALKELDSPKFNKIISIVAEELPKLEPIF